MICEKCGHEMKSHIEYSNKIWECPECGWNIATTFINPIYEDTTRYKIILLSNTHADKKIVSLLKLYLKDHSTPQILNMLREGGKVLIEGNAADIIKHKKKFDEIELLYSITPSFPWSEEEL